MAIPEFHHSFLMARGQKWRLLQATVIIEKIWGWVDVATLQQTADFLIEKELMNLLFTENDV